MPGKRIEYIDTAKFLAMLLVIFCHGTKEGNVAAFICSFHVPVFFFLNGMTLKIGEQKFGDFLVKKLKGLIIPMFGLGIIAIFLDMFIRAIFNNPIPGNHILVMFAYLINQMRFLALWFLPVLLFCDLMMFGIYRLTKGNVWLMALPSFAILAIGLTFVAFHNVVLAWNFDTSMIAIIFTYFGYLFSHKDLSFLNKFVKRHRVLPLLAGIALLAGTYFLSLYIYAPEHRHLEMFAKIYGKFYLTLPCAFMGSIGFVLFCRGVSTPVFARPVQMNLALLAFHQAFTFPLFRFVVVKDWWQQVALLDPNNPKYIAFNLAMLAFTLAVIGAIHFAIRLTPFAAIVNQPQIKILQIFRRKKEQQAQV